jgi:hypothetical protein
VLDPMERISEVLFGLIVVLTITGALAVATEHHPDIRTMLIGAIGCNLAWRIIDGGMYPWPASMSADATSSRCGRYEMRPTPPLRAGSSRMRCRRCWRPS